MNCRKKPFQNRVQRNPGPLPNPFPEIEAHRGQQRVGHFAGCSVQIIPISLNYHINQFFGMKVSLMGLPTTIKESFPKIGTFLTHRGMDS
jgi:hypothetical protein